MRNYDNVPAVAVLVLTVLSAWTPRVQAQEEADLKVSTPAVITPASSPAGIRYDVLFEQEHRVSKSAASAAGDFRIIINRYWNFVRRYPSSGYADNALWQAANLSTEAFARFGEDRDRFRAIQLFQWLRDQYPHSRYLANASAHIEQLAAMQGEAQPHRPSDSTIRAVRRELLPEVVRVTIELDREVPFHHERIESPSRLFFDLKGTRTIPALVDATFRYESDVVRHIRLGRHPNNTVRIVLDLENVGRYSVFTLYNPYRIVIDSERAGSPPAARLDVETDETETPLPRQAPEPAAKPLPPSANSSGKFSVARQLGLGVSRVVIDAGHGGHDPGASAFGISEAELVLDVALRLEKLLQQQPGIEAVLTRRTNDYLSLEERTEIANRESADFFLSIHANASANAAASGVETYFLNFALNRQAEAVAARENAASGKTMSSLPDIIKAITLNSKLNESRDFAGSIQRALVRGLRPGNKTVKDLGVKQAPFMVLIGASMPSVLAEISFVTNRQEARLLKAVNYRQSIADALLDGILRYQASLKKVQTAALQ
jgi:N-acetylmuramoyl-L-alanine amidase